MDIRTDFCVVGGGPAGLTLALLLAKSGVRVTVVEKSQSMEREFRGEILQPGAQHILHELGVLTGAKDRGCHEHDRFLLEENGRVLINGNYRVLPGPFNCLLSLPQEHLLAALLEQCHRYAGFEYLPGARVTELLHDGDTVQGVACHGGQVVHARCVIGADGRYSKVRQAAGIPYDRTEAFDQDVLWFKVPADGQLPRNVRVFRAGGNPIIAYASMPDSIQMGWTLPHQSYRELASKGIEHVKEQLSLAAPAYAPHIQQHISSFKELSLLDVFSGMAQEWASNGLLLIGDSAHTHGPIGAQGINLAIQDAVLAHPILLQALDAGTDKKVLDQFTQTRRPDINRIMKIQMIQGKAMLAATGVAAKVRPKMAALMSRTPVYRWVLGQLAFGNPQIQIHSELFRD